MNRGPAQNDIRDPRSLAIERFYIRKAHQGRGLGTLLMNHALQVAVEAQSTYVWLGVWERLIGDPAAGSQQARPGPSTPPGLSPPRTGFMA